MAAWRTWKIYDRSQNSKTMTKKIYFGVNTSIFRYEEFKNIKI